MKKKYVVIFSVLIMFVTIIVLVFLLMKKDDSNNYSLSNTNKNNIGSFLTLMLEQSDGSYQKSTSNTWPTGNYAFNSTLSGCERGGELEWDREANIVKLLSNKSDKCYVYFDLYNVVKITNVTSTKTTNSVTLTVTIEAGENAVDKYYFSSDGGNSYQESTFPNYTFSNLTPNTKYTFQVYAKDTEGYESNEEVVEVTTDNYVNPTVNSVSVTDTSTDSISISVSASSGTNNIATYYYSINNGSYTSSSSNSYTFSGLSKGTTYTIKVYVKDTNEIESSVYTISAETENNPLLADYIKSLYTSQGSNGLYYHTSSLANSAADNSYRYAGANPNNYICFGSDASTCPEDNLYRIIGVFGSEVKLIMADYSTKNQTGTSGAYMTDYHSWFQYASEYKGSKDLSLVGVYMWNPNMVNIWNTSTLNTINLNNTFLNLFNLSWQNKIANHIWYVDGHNNATATPKEFYNSESKGTTYTAKIGLMYVSDYGFSAENNSWKYEIDGFGTFSYNNWMFMGLSEWTISRDSSSSLYDVFVVQTHGSVTSRDEEGDAIRPVFYLNSNVSYVSGDGTQSNPIRIN